MEKYYFVNECEPGWVEILAPGIRSASRIFRDLYPDKDRNPKQTYVYTEEQFRRTEMAVSGNRGQRCYKRVTVTVEEVEA